MTFKQFKKKMLRRQTDSIRLKPKDMLRFNKAQDAFAKINMVVSIASMVIVLAIVLLKPSDIISLVVCAITLAILVYTQFYSKGAREVNSILKELYEQIK